MSLQSPSLLRRPYRHPLKRKITELVPIDRGATRPKRELQSPLQQRLDVQAEVDRLLDMQLTVPLRSLLALSPQIVEGLGTQTSRHYVPVSSAALASAPLKVLPVKRRNLHRRVG